MATTGDIGDKAGFVMLIKTAVKFGDSSSSDKKEYVVNFDLENSVRPSRWSFLQFETKGVDYSHNKVYINDNEVGKLYAYGGSDWHGSSICVMEYAVTAGVNTFKVEALNSSGGTSGNRDDFSIRNVVLMYAVQ